MTVRKLCALGNSGFDRTAANRIKAAVGRSIAIKGGDLIRLDEKMFATYTATLQAFARTLANRITNYPIAKAAP